MVSLNKHSRSADAAQLKQNGFQYLGIKDQKLVGQIYGHIIFHFHEQICTISTNLKARSN